MHIFGLCLLVLGFVFQVIGLWEASSALKRFHDLPRPENGVFPAWKITNEKFDLLIKRYQGNFHLMGFDIVMHKHYGLFLKVQDQFEEDKRTLLSSVVLIFIGIVLSFGGTISLVFFPFT